MKIFSKLNLFLCMVCGGLAYFIYLESTRPIERVPKLEETVSPNDAVLRQSRPTGADQIPPRDQFTQLISRPPFAATRRPPQPRPVAVATVSKPQPLAKPRIVLVGTFVNSVSGIAVIQKLGADKQLRLALGENIDGWTLESIHRDRIVLKSRSDTFEVMLRNPGSSNRP